MAKKMNFPTLHLVIERFGAVRYAKVDVNSLTVVCGKNNMGKTYATYAFYWFLDFWRRGFMCSLPTAKLKQLFDSRTVRFELNELVEWVESMLRKASEAYSKPEVLSEVFGGDKSFFEHATFSLTLDKNDVRSMLLARGLEKERRSGQVKLFDWEFDGQGLCVSFTAAKFVEEVPVVEIFEQRLSDCLKAAVLHGILPTATISCAERTGAVIFQKELDFTRNRIVEMLGGSEVDKIPSTLFFRRFSACYPLPIRRNVDIARTIPENLRSFLVDGSTPDGKEVMRLFCDIIGGEYKVVKGEIRFVPKDGKALRLDMVLSSSSVRALMHLGAYLMYQTRIGDILILDEPEQNLHPVNQRKIARLIGRLVNLGVRVFVTTHSDYIVREFNNLIMMNKSGKAVEKIRNQYAYDKGELLACDWMNVYCARREKLLVPGNKIQAWVQTLAGVEVDPVLGIDAQTFDETINDMNRLQEELMFAGDES